MSPTPSESKTRAHLIDPAFQKAGWEVSNPAQVRLEIPVVIATSGYIILRNRLERCITKSTAGW